MYVYMRGSRGEHAIYYGVPIGTKKGGYIPIQSHPFIIIFWLDSIIPMFQAFLINSFNPSP